MNKYNDSIDYLTSVANGEKHARLISKESFLRLFELANRNGRLLDGFEPFRIEGELEIAHPELTVTPLWFHGLHKDMPWGERYEEMKKIMALSF